MGDRWDDAEYRSFQFSLPIAETLVSIDLASYSVTELEQLIVDANNRAAHLRKQSQGDIRRQLEARAREAGFDIRELLASRPGRKRIHR